MERTKWEWFGLRVQSRSANLHYINNKKAIKFVWDEDFSIKLDELYNRHRLFYIPLSPH